MSRPFIRCTFGGALCALALLAQGCGEAAHSQKVRREAQDRYDRAGAQIVYDQARQSFHSGQFEQALSHADRAIVRFPKDSSYHLLRGRILHEMMRVEDARDAFAKSAELDPKKPEPHYFMGIIHQRWREHDRAIECYAKASELDPSKLHFSAAEVEMLTLAGRHDEADARLVSMERSFEFSPVVDRLHADLAKMRGDHHACASRLERAAVRETASPDLVEELAFARYSKGDHAGSLAALEDPVLEKRARRPDLARLRARNLVVLGRPSEARDVLLGLRDERDHECRTALLLGHAAWRLSDWARLRECGEELVRRRPELADGYLFLGASARAAGRMDESLAMFEQALAREPEREIAQRFVAAACDAGERPMGAPEAAAGAIRTDAP
jgi:tetratricopeptide (TPR) repeat protein